MTDVPETERPWPKVSRLRTAGPVVLIVAALVAAGAVATVNEHSTTAPSHALFDDHPAGVQQRGAHHVRRCGQGRTRRRLRLGFALRPQDRTP